MLGTFSTEDEWRRAYEAAEVQINAAIARGEFEWPNGKSPSTVVRRLAQDVATAVILSSCVGDDITTVKGVEVEAPIGVATRAVGSTFS